MAKIQTDNQAKTLVFYNFLKRNEEAAIRKYVNKKLVPFSYDKLISKEKNFFQAVKEIIGEYLGDESFDEIKNLLNIFNSFKNLEIIRVEQLLFSELIKENKQLIAENEVIRNGIKSILIKCCGCNEDNSDNTVLKLLGNGEE